MTSVEGGKIALSKEFVRDIRKLWIKTDGKKVYLCIENQTNLDIKDQVRMTIYTLVHILSIMEKTGEVLPVVPLIIVWDKIEKNKELNIRDLFPVDTPEEIMKYQISQRIPVIYVLDIKEEDLEILSLPLKEAIMPIQIMSRLLELDQVERYVNKLDGLVKTVLDENAKKTVIAVTDYDFYEDTKLGKEDAVKGDTIYDVLEYLKDKAVADAKSKGISEGIAQGISQGMEQGLAQGIAQGISQGMEQGLAQGKEQGMAEGRINTLADNVIKLVEAKEYSYEKALEILVETETEKKEVLKRIKEMKQ